VRVYPVAVFASVLLAAGCGGPPDAPVKTSALARAERRAYDGAPPVIPHVAFGSPCTQCHTAQGAEVPGVGFAPASPHRDTPGIGEVANCRQCHVFRRTDEIFVASSFEGLPQDLEPGDRLFAGAPPVIPHPVFLRENCLACHTGPAAREEIRCTHPERVNCRQCHVPGESESTFARD